MQHEKMHERNREEELRAQVEILALEIDHISAAVDESLAIAAPELAQTRNKSDMIQIYGSHFFLEDANLRT
jgi:hypothetical protein